jgi:hypothetical protein
MSTATPYLITGEDATGEQLRLLPSREKAFQEDWLQELLFKHPSILPVDQLDEAFASPISIGREIAGIDNLFISPRGLLTLVETKLWRNPEAHRTVVAQILDYAKTLTTWEYQELDKSVQISMQRLTGKPIDIYQTVKRKAKDLDLSEIEFQDKVQDCLYNGRFALLIVGDKIYPGATQLAETIQSAPHLQFSIGFVELQCYRFSKDSTWPLVVFPYFVAKTKEITRAVVKVLYEEKKPEIQVDTPSEKETPSGFTNFAEYIASLPSGIADIFRLHIDSWMKAGYTVYWGKVGFSVRLRWKRKMVTIFDAYPTNAGILKNKWVEEYDLPKKPYETYREELMASSVIGSALATGKRYINYEDMSQDEVRLLLTSTDKLLSAIQKEASS